MPNTRVFPLLSKSTFLPVDPDQSWKSRSRKAGSIEMADCSLYARKSTCIDEKEVTCVVYEKRYAFNVRRSSSSTGYPRIGNVRRGLVDATNVTGKNTPAAEKKLFLPRRWCIQRDWSRFIFHAD